MKCLKVKNILLMSTMIMLFLAVVFCATDVSYATTIHEFTISSTDGHTWILKENGSTVLEETGSWNTNEEVDAIFSSKIDELVGADDYVLTFDFPNDLLISYKDSTGVNPSDVNESVYTENDESDIYILLEGNNFIGGSTISLEYKTKDSDSYDNRLTQISSLFKFGNMIDVGEYDVRGLMVESFKFKDRDYLVSRTSSNVLDCTITINPNPPMRELSEADRTMEYGATLSDIANKLSSTSGLYKVAASEIALDANIESKILPYDVYNQTCKFDYFPTNTNYENKTDIEIDIKIDKKRIEIVIDNAQILCGQNNIDLNTFVKKFVRTPLVGEDTENDLGLSLYFANKFGEEVTVIDTSESNEYLIKARVANINYMPISINWHQTSYSGGRYFIFPIDIKFSEPEMEISLNKMGGFEHVIPKVFKYEDLSDDIKQQINFTYDDVNYHIDNIYVLAFEEQNNYTFEKYNEEFFIKVKSILNSEYLMYNKKGIYSMNDFSKPVEIWFNAGEADQYIVFVSLTENRINHSGFEWYHGLMIGFISISLIASIVAVVLYKKRRWFFI